MAVSSIRQRGITLIEILLVATIVAAGVVGVFMFAKKASVSAAVESEQSQVELLVRTIESSFALEPNFAALGTNGAAYLRDHARQAGIELTTDDVGGPALATRLGSGTVELKATQVDFANGVSGVPNNGFVLVYSGLSSEECIGLITATSALTTRTDVGTSSGIAGGVLVAHSGKVISDKGVLASACAGSATASSGPPVVHLSFAPSRPIASTTATLAPPSTCAPVRETQLTACPPGRVGSITQERHGVCSGSDNTIVYTAWENIEPMEDTCLLEGTTPTDQTATPLPRECGLIKQTRARVCPAPSGQYIPGNIVEEREVNTCLGTTSAWEELANSCQEVPPAATCTAPPPRPAPIACPAGQGGEIQRVIYSSCPSPTGDPVEEAPVVVSNNCTSSCMASDTCCTVQRQTQTVMEPCPAGTYGDSGSEQERFRGCLNAQTQGPWGPWQTMTSSGSCTACPTVPPNTDFQWVNRERTCPAGETGKITYQAEQVRTQTVSYNCPAGTTSLPAPTYGSWSSWTDTGNTRNEVNNCTPEPESSCASEPPVYVNLGQAGHSLRTYDYTPPTPSPGYFFTLPDTTPAHAPAWVKSAVGPLRSNVAGQYSPAVHGPAPIGYEGHVLGPYALAATNTGAGLGSCVDPASVGTVSYYYSYGVLQYGVSLGDFSGTLDHSWSGQTAACMSACDAEAFYDNWPPAPDCATAYSTALTYGRITNDDDMLGNGLPTPGEPLLKASAVNITSTGTGCSATLETTRYPTNAHWSTTFGYEGGQIIHWVKTN